MLSTSITSNGFFHVCYQPLAEFLGDGQMAGLVQRLHYWLQNEKVGYILGDGCKWIFSTYQDLQKQFSWLSAHKIGRFIRHLESINWLVSDRYHNLKKEIGFTQGLPPGFQAYNQTKWYRLDYKKIHLDTGFEFNDTEEKPKQPKRSRGANVQNCTMQYTELHDAIYTPAQSSIYKEIPISISQIGEILREKETKEIDQEPELDPWLDQEEELQLTPHLEDEVKEAPPEEPVTSHEGQCSATSGQGFTKINNKKSKDLEKQIWEIAPKRPYPVFLNWWADKRYKPQGGKWEAAATSNAYSEFYKDCDRTTVAIFPEFLEYMQQVAENCNQQLASGIKALLPSCFVAKPESTRENVNQLMQNISELVESGVQVALPANSCTPSCTQSMEFAIASGAKDIAALKTLKSQEPQLLTGTNLGDREKLLDELAKRQMTWKNAPIMRASVKKWVEQTPGVVMSPDGPVLADE
ncbi:MAG TPA: hypothetical protein VE944_29200 [Nostoc sp.]|uniref:hypothetical protein n=1 Tax=Nostoc sp. TaxID=1180 RepID=UPI002D427F0A|nr:hypothetical protein [Nostoc sp.]HYX18371.1 hypothetical protein [Nostoc sp.]